MVKTQKHIPLFAGDGLHPVALFSYKHIRAEPGINRTIIIVDKIFLIAKN
jgi:hypothetical protein